MATISGQVCWGLAGGGWPNSHVTRFQWWLNVHLLFQFEFSYPQNAALGFDGAGGFNRVNMEASRLPVACACSDLPYGLGQHESTSRPSSRRRNMDTTSYVSERSCK